jgi:hypothetical protein
MFDISIEEDLTDFELFQEAILTALAVASNIPKELIRTTYLTEYGRKDIDNDS